MARRGSPTVGCLCYRDIVRRSRKLEVEWVDASQLEAATAAADPDAHAAAWAKLRNSQGVLVPGATLVAVEACVCAEPQQDFTPAAVNAQAATISGACMLPCICHRSGPWATWGKRGPIVMLLNSCTSFCSQPFEVVLLHVSPCGTMRLSVCSQFLYSQSYHLSCCCCCCRHNVQRSGRKPVGSHEGWSIPRRADDHCKGKACVHSATKPDCSLPWQSCG